MLRSNHRSGSAVSVNSKVVETYTSVQLLCCKLSVDLNNKDFKDVQAFPDLSLYGNNILGHTLAQDCKHRLFTIRKRSAK